MSAAPKATPAKHRIDVSRIVRVRQIATWEGEAATYDEACDKAEQDAEDGNLNWADDDADIPEVDDGSYEFEPGDEDDEKA